MSLTAYGLVRDVEKRFWRRFEQACRLGQDLELSHIAEAVREDDRMHDDATMHIIDLGLDWKHEVAAFIDQAGELNLTAVNLRRILGANGFRSFLAALLEHYTMDEWDEG